MKIRSFACAALAASLLPAVALADNPNDPSMRNPAARARDREGTRQLNLAALQDVRARQARGELGWRPGHASDSANSDYARERARYERDMAVWRRAVAACRAGDYSACDN